MKTTQSPLRGCSRFILNATLSGSIPLIMEKASYLKVFFSNNAAMVALFTSNSDWIENIPAQDVFNSNAYSSLPLEEVLLISGLPIDYLKAEFIDARTDAIASKSAESTDQTLPIGSLAIKLAQRMNIPQKDALKFTAQLFRLMQRHLSAGRTLNSAFASIKPLGVDSTVWLLEFTDPKP